MPFLISQDFRLGVDRRRRRVAGAPGSLWDCINAHLTRGGDVEKRKKFVEKWSVPGTFGLKVTRGVGYVFGSTVDPGVPSGVTYQRLQSPSPLAPAMTALNDVGLYDGKVYAIATFADGNTHHFYDGTYVSAWDDGVVRSYTTGLDVIAARLTALINANATEKATATSVGGVITITGKTNNVALHVTAEAEDGGTVDDQTAVVATTQASSASLPEITKVTLGGTLDVGDRFAVTLDVNQYGAGDNPATVATRIITFNSKIYALAGSQVYFCSIGDATLWRAEVLGAGRINVATKEQGSLVLVGVARYQTGLAFFSDDTIQTWTIDEDPAKNAVDRTLLKTGAVAGRSVVTYGNNDTFYLSRSGLRSLQARMLGTIAPFVSDSGNAIDTLLQARMKEIGASETANAIAEIELVDGRYTMALGDKIYVLSYFPGSKINGWSWYEPTECPDFSADWVSVDSGQMFIRSGDTVYLYGGDDGDTYDSTDEDMYEVIVGTPFLSGKRPTVKKVANSYDVSATNEWLVEALVDSRDETRKVTLGTLTEDTAPDQSHPSSFEGTGFALQFTCSQPGAATLTGFAVDFDEDEGEAGR